MDCCCCCCCCCCGTGSEEVVSIVALLSTDSILVNTTHQRQQAAAARAKFATSEGDHLTLLNIFRAFRAAKTNRVTSLYPVSTQLQPCFI